jgi:hypothetical protein
VRSSLQTSSFLRSNKQVRTVRSQIQYRREQLAERRQLLTLAKEQDGSEISNEIEQEVEVDNGR